MVGLGLTGVAGVAVAAGLGVWQEPPEVENVGDPGVGVGSEVDMGKTPRGERKADANGGRGLL